MITLLFQTLFFTFFHDIFSAMKIIKSARRTRLNQDTLESLMRIHGDGQSIMDFDAVPSIHRWMETGPGTRHLGGHKIPEKRPGMFIDLCQYLIMIILSMNYECNILFKIMKQITFIMNTIYTKHALVMLAMPKQTTKVDFNIISWVYQRLF